MSNKRVNKASGASGASGESQELGERIAKALERGAHERGAREHGSDTSAGAASGERAGERGRVLGLGYGVRVAVDLVAAVLVGLALGAGFDHLTELSPVGLIVGLILGMMAGVLNVYKLVGGLGHEASSGSPGAASRRADSKHKADKAVKG